MVDYILDIVQFYFQKVLNHVKPNSEKNRFTLGVARVNKHRCGKAMTHAGISMGKCIGTWSTNGRFSTFTYVEVSKNGGTFQSSI